MKRFLSGAVAAAAIAYLPNLAPAEDPAAPQRPKVVFFKQLDANGDGQLTKAELPPEKHSLFEHLIGKADADKNGSLSATEFAQALEDQEKAAQSGPKPGGQQFAAGINPQQFFKRHDANGDGVITADEVAEKGRPQFQKALKYADADGNGAISKAELVAGIERLKAAEGGKNAAGKPKNAGADFNPVAFLKRLDANSDGKVTENEVPPQGKERFAKMLKRLDKNGDGAIGLEEAEAGKEPGKGTEAPETAQKPNPRQLVRRLMNTDKDGDGKLAQSDLPKWLQEKFNQLDGDQDGFVTQPELGKHAVELQALVQKRQQETKKGIE